MNYLQGWWIKRKLFDLIEVEGRRIVTRGWERVEAEGDGDRMVNGSRGVTDRNNNFWCPLARKGKYA